MKKDKGNIHHSGRLALHIMPVLVWIIALSGVVWLFTQRTMRFDVIGIAQGQLRQIAATITGRLESVPVQLFQEVRKGATLAILDDSLVVAELDTANAEIARLRAELNAARDRLMVESADRQNDMITVYRRFEVDIEQSRLGILELKAALEPDMIRLQDLQLELEITRNLLDRDAVAPYELQKAQMNYDVLSKTVEENKIVLGQSEADLQQAQKRLSDFNKLQKITVSPDSSLDAISKAINVQQYRMDELSVRRAGLVLKSPFTGIVSKIHSRLGEAVLPGEPVVSVAESSPMQIVAYVSENRVAEIKEGREVEIVGNNLSHPAQTVMSQVSSLGPNVELMPQRLWQNPNIPQWGRPVLIAVHPDLRLIPGQRVAIRGL